MSESDKPYDQLTALYQNKAMASVLPPQYETDGFIYAVAAAPEIPMPERWMPWLIRPSQGSLRSDDVDIIADHLMGCLREHLAAMRNDKVVLPPECRWQKAASEGIPDALSSWLKGLLEAHHHVEVDWQKVWNESNASEDNTASRADRLRRSLRLFSTLADVDMALRARSPEQAQTLKENLSLLWRQLPEQLRDYVRLSGELAGMLPNQFETFQQPNQDSANDAD